MTSFFAKAAAATMIALAALTTTVSTASAGGHHGHRGPGHHWHHSGPGFGFGFHYGRPEHRPGPHGCTPRRAIEKAHGSGMRRAHVDRVSPRSVVVAGYRHHRYDRMVFANAPGCPVIRR